MIIYDGSGNVMKDPDLAHGWIDWREETIHLGAREAHAEVGHYEVIAEYSNGGRDVQWVVDEPAVEACDEHDEVRRYAVYVPYTADELEALEREKSKPTDVAILQAQIAALTAQNEFLEDCIAEMAMVIYG